MVFVWARTAVGIQKKAAILAASLQNRERNACLIGESCNYFHRSGLHVFINQIYLPSASGEEHMAAGPRSSSRPSRRATQTGNSSRRRRRPR